MPKAAPPDAFANTPEPPYYAVIFTSQRRDADEDFYHEIAAKMAELALKQPGCLGAESARDANGFGLTVSYFSSLEAIKLWRDHAEHQPAQNLGRETFYRHYELRIARVERAYSWSELD